MSQKIGWTAYLSAIGVRPVSESLRLVHHDDSPRRGSGLWCLHSFGIVCFGYFEELLLNSISRGIAEGQGAAVSNRRRMETVSLETMGLTSGMPRLETEV